MGFLSKVKDAFVGGITSSIGTKAENVSGKVLGIPSPGQEARTFMDQAYPGTNPWERLGAQGGVASVAAQQQRSQRTMQSKEQSNQRYMQEKELQTRRYVADKAASSRVISSGLPVGSGSVRGGLAALRGGSVADWDTAVGVMVKKMPFEISQAKARTVKDVSEAPRNLAQAGLFKQQTKNLRDRLLPEINKLNAETQKALADYAVALSNNRILEAKGIYAKLQARADLDKTRLGYLLPHRPNTPNTVSYTHLTLPTKA